ncbi:MAG: response regulator transcription factor [Pseudomonadota bacterium]
MKVLIVEDDTAIATAIDSHLSDAGFVTHVVHDGEEAKFMGESDEYDAIVLDLGLPSVDGTELLKHWRDLRVSTSIIVLTARTAKHEVVNALEAGADDFIAKPFDADVVAARIRAAVRRAGGGLTSRFQHQGVVLDASSGRVTQDGAIVKLTRTEYLLLQFLFMRQGQVVSITEIADHIYDDFDHDSGIIQRHVANIRKKLGASVILTESNRGYHIPSESADG